jgi:hypothetical protein
MGQFSDLLLGHTQLQSRMSFSHQQLGRVREALSNRQACCRPELCIYAAGSLARLETGRASDMDLFFIAHRSDRDGKQRSISHLDEVRAFADLIALNEALGLQQFSGDGQYLKIHELDDVIDGTGSSDDDSENLFTTRLLLLLESKPIAGEDLYRSAVSRVLDMYFRDGRGRKDFRPLFILNDILRYWRTLCLNYERDRNSAGKPWWKRNLNLKFPRKLTVFSTVMSIIATRTSTSAEFMRIIEYTPLQRLAYALDTMNDNSLEAPFASMLDDYEDFLAAKSHSELDAPTTAPLVAFSAKAQKLDDLLHGAFASPKLDRSLVRYVLI